MTLEHRQKHIGILIYVGIVAATLVAYEPIRHNGFVNYDDDKYITKNPEVTGGITWQSVTWAFTKFHSSNWHPLTWLSHMLDCQFFGLNPSGHHFVSVAIHIANALLLFWILTNITGPLAKCVCSRGFRTAPVSGGIRGMGSGAKDGIKRTILAFDNGRIYTLCKKTRIRPIYATAVYIRPLYYDQAECCYSSFGIAAAGLLAFRQGQMGTSGQSKGRNDIKSEINGMANGEKIPLLAISAILGVLTVSRRIGRAIITLDKISLTTE